MSDQKAAEKQRLEQSIIDQCLDESGLLVMLRENRFDEVKYQRLVEAIKGYKEAIGDDTMINRQVAGCFWIIETIFSNTLAYYAWHDKDAAVAKRIGNAAEEIWLLTNDIFYFDSP